MPLHQSFDYLADAGVAPVRPGMRVVVPFGRREVVGLAWPDAGGERLPAARLKRVRRVLDETPLFSPDDMALLAFAARYYHQPVGEVAAAALPPLLKSPDATQLQAEFWSLTEAGREAMTAALQRKAPKQHALLQALADGARSAERLHTALPGWRRVTRALTERGLIAREQRALDADWSAIGHSEPGPTLNAQQRGVLSAIEAAGRQFHVALIDGVTGSGKTEIYLQLIAGCIARGEQVLVLVPEIGLTPQLASRFERRLGYPVALLHSSLGDTERTLNWQAAASGKARIVLGTRSAVFTPLVTPGLIIIDEEHDPSLKQHEGFRYHARDLAVWRAQRHDIPIVLGSATPSLETLPDSRCWFT